MIKKKLRLKKNYEYNHVYKKGTSVGSKIIVLYAAKNREKESLKIGFSVSKKLGKSVIRNRAKRLMREATRNSLSQFKKGYNYIILARKPIIESGYSEVLSALQYVLKKNERGI